MVNAFLMSVRHLGTTLLVLLMSFVPAVCLLLVPSAAALIGLIWMFIGISLPAYFASGFFLRVFGRYAALDSSLPSSEER